jgi:cytochrome c oxidase assembly protein Cox11
LRHRRGGDKNAVLRDAISAAGKRIAPFTSGLHILHGQATRGHAVYNVTPHEAGKYFNKIECFCFQEQTIAAHQTVNFPVSFFIDPAILEDKDLRDLRNITLSYTFFSYESRNQ